jgi:5-methylcytosine-specific restriction endonuclease McrA
MTWTEFYQNKLAQRNQGGGRCEWCGKQGPTESHHLFQRRPDHEYLQVDWNIAQLCNECHAQESHAMQVALAKRRIEKWGADHIEQWAEGAPFKTGITLPSHYWEAKEIHENEKSVDRVPGRQRG